MGSKFRSFTLVELLIALSILSIIAYLSASSFISIRRATEWNSQNVETRRAVDNLIDTLDNELASALYISSNKRTLFRSNRTENAGIKINDLRFSYIDPISFYELNKRDEVVEVEYEVEKDGGIENKYRIDKRIWYFAMHPDRPEERNPDARDTVLENVDFFTMRFYSKGKWYDSWDTEKMRELPDMVELDLSVNGKEYREYFNVCISEF